MFQRQLTVQLSLTLGEISPIVSEKYINLTEGGKTWLYWKQFQFSDEYKSTPKLTWRQTWHRCPLLFHAPTEALFLPANDGNKGFYAKKKKKVDGFLIFCEIKIKKEGRRKKGEKERNYYADQRFFSRLLKSKKVLILGFSFGSHCVLSKGKFRLACSKGYKRGIILDPSFNFYICKTPTLCTAYNRLHKANNTWAK